MVGDDGKPATMLAPWSRGRMGGLLRGGFPAMTERCETAAVAARQGACLLAALALAGLGGCAADRPPPAGEPSMYVSMAAPEAELDAAAAAAMISGYRANNGLIAVSI